MSDSEAVDVANKFVDSLHGAKSMAESWKTFVDEVLPAVSQLEGVDLDGVYHLFSAAFGMGFGAGLDAAIAEGDEVLLGYVAEIAVAWGEFGGDASDEEGEPE